MKLSMEQYRRDNLTWVVWDKMQTQVLITIVALTDINNITNVIIITTTTISILINISIMIMIINIVVMTTISSFSAAGPRALMIGSRLDGLATAGANLI